MNKTVLKIGFILLGIALFAFGNTYLFNHVQPPWIAVIVTWVGVIIVAATLIHWVIQYFSSEDEGNDI